MSPLILILVHTVLATSQVDVYEDAKTNPFVKR